MSGESATGRLCADGSGLCRYCTALLSSPALHPPWNAKYRPVKAIPARWLSRPTPSSPFNPHQRGLPDFLYSPSPSLEFLYPSPCWTPGGMLHDTRPAWRAIDTFVLVTLGAFGTDIVFVDSGYRLWAAARVFSTIGLFASSYSRRKKEIGEVCCNANTSHGKPKLSVKE